MAKEFKMSQARYDELKQELDYSKTTRADEVAELIKEARGFGDLSENSEYDEAKNEQGKLYSRIAELEDILLPRSQRGLSLRQSPDGPQGGRRSDCGGASRRHPLPCGQY